MPYMATFNYHQYNPNVSIYTIHGSYGVDDFPIETIVPSCSFRAAPAVAAAAPLGPLRTPRCPPPPARPGPSEPPRGVAPGSFCWGIGGASWEYHARF